MKVYVYIDESGSIHKNSKTRYFAVGGYLTFFEGKNKIISLYKKCNKSIKDKRNIDLKKTFFLKHHSIHIYLTYYIIHLCLEQIAYYL